MRILIWHGYLLDGTGSTSTPGRSPARGAGPVMTSSWSARNRTRRLERGARAQGSGQGRSELKRESGKGLFVGGVKLPLALTELGLIDEYEFVVHPRLAGHGPTLFAGLSKHVDLKLVSRLEFGSGAVAMRYVPRR